MTKKMRSVYLLAFMFFCSGVYAQTQWTIDPSRLGSNEEVSLFIGGAVSEELSQILSLCPPYILLNVKDDFQARYEGSQGVSYWKSSKKENILLETTIEDLRKVKDINGPAPLGTLKNGNFFLSSSNGGIGQAILYGLRKLTSAQRKNIKYFRCEEVIAGAAGGYPGFSFAICEIQKVNL